MKVNFSYASSLFHVIVLMHQVIELNVTLALACPMDIAMLLVYIAWISRNLEWACNLDTQSYWWIQLAI